MNLNKANILMAALGVIALIGALIIPQSALAYIDPGTGSAVFGSLAYILALGGAALSVVVLLARKFWGGLKRLFTRRPTEKV